MTRKSKKLSPAFMPGAISFGQVVEKDEDKITNETKATYQEVLVGEILINPINLNYDLKSLRTALSDINVCVSSAYIVACPNSQVNKSWLKNMMYCFDVNHMKTLGAGVRQTITFDDIGNCVTAKPPLAEQRAIADYLDRQTALIDQRLSTLAEKKVVLTELRKASIHEAVTKGLNKTAAMKDSGVMWIGPVPRHWTRFRIKDICRAYFGQATKDASKYVSLEHVTPWLGTYKAADRAEAEATTGQFISAGVMCFSKLRPYLAKAFVAKETLFVTTELLTFVPRHTVVDVIFLTRFVLTHGFITEVNDAVAGTKMPRVDWQIFATRTIFLPPIIEQRAIANHLDQQTQHIDAQLATLDEQVQVLKELRKAIIHEAVTGKIVLPSPAGGRRAGDEGL